MITLPLLRHIWDEHRLIFTVSGVSYQADCREVERMLQLDDFAPLRKPDGRPGGSLFLSKSGNTVYAETSAGKYRFPYGRFITTLILPTGFVIGTECDGRKANA